MPNRAATRKPAELGVGSGDVPSPGDSASAEVELLGVVTGSLLGAIAGTRSPLAAELVLCGVFGTLEQGLDEDVEDWERSLALITVLGQVIAEAEGLASPEALALLRVCAVLGPTQTREAAEVAAGRLAAAGVPERAWASRVGHPVLMRAWRYGDVFGAQSSVGVLFDYQGREHVVMVLIDHLLGGGVKDCWVAEGRLAKGLRNSVAAAMASSPSTYFEDLDTATAAEHLRSALASPPCAEQDDQVQDVAANLYLLRARSDLLARLAGLPPLETVGVTSAAAASPAASSPAVLQIKVSIQGVRPPIWRRLEVPATISLTRLHAVLQSAFGWTNTHLWGFEVDQGGGRPGAIEGPVLRRTRLESIAGTVGDTLVYRYDYGDDWTHLIQVEARHRADLDLTYPRCTGGRRAGPVEDVGGAPGYAMLLEALADPGHPEHQEMTEWAPAGFDPAVFDRGAINIALNEPHPPTGARPVT